MKKIILLIISVWLYALSGEVPVEETNGTLQNKTLILESKESNLSANVNFTYQPVINEIELNDTYVSFNTNVNLAVVINKERFFKYLPSLMNALNAYFAQKGVDYNITLYNSDINLSKIQSGDIIYFTTNLNKLNVLKNSDKRFYLPLINKNETNITSKNLYFGSIDFKKQINILSSFIDSKTCVIADNTQLSQKLTAYEKSIPYIKNIYKFPNINYKNLNASFIIFNTNAGETAQVLSTITQKEIQTKLNLSPQIGYDPLMIILTQPADIKKLLIANSIIHPPLIINEYASLLNSDIRYNWLNYSTCILANKIYNKQNEEDEFYMNDFNIYIFDNQIDYQTKLYKIFNGAFKQVK